MAAIKRTASIAALSIALGLGSATALAPTASAAAGEVGPSACRYNSPDVNFTIDVKSTKLRKGPGKRYAGKAELRKGETFRYICRTWAGFGAEGFKKSWSYGKVVKQTKQGKRVVKGWVSSRYLD